VQSPARRLNLQSVCIVRLEVTIDVDTNITVPTEPRHSDTQAT
jgi:hypothetical protein